MTRDRPAAGGTDSTLEGEFPSELGSEGGGRASPLQVDNRVSVPYGGGPDRFKFKYGEIYDETFAKDYVTNNPPRIRIYNKPLYDAGIASYELNGIYAVNEGSPFYNNYPFWYNREQNAIGTNSNTGSDTITTNLTIPFTAYDYTRPAGFLFNLRLSAAGTTIPSNEVSFSATMGSVTPQYFTGTTTYQDELLQMYNRNSITPNETATEAFIGAPAPNFVWEYRSAWQTIRRVPFIPNTSTTLTFGMSIGIGSFGQTSLSVDFELGMFHNFTRAQNLDPIKSF